MGRIDLPVGCVVVVESMLIGYPRSGLEERCGNFAISGIEGNRIVWATVSFIGSIVVVKRIAESAAG